MSIEKLDFSSVKQANKSFTTYLNEVIQNIKNPLILGIYCYLGTLPPTWEVNVKHLMNHFDIGRDKVKNTLKWLKDNHLLEYEQERNEEGKFGSGAIIIKDGFDFLVYRGFFSPAVLKSSITDHTAVLKTRTPVNPDTGKSAPIKYISNRNKKNERESTPTLKPISSNFKPSQKQKALAKEYELDIDQEKNKFIDFYKSRGDKREKWRPEFNNWLKRSYEYNLNKNSKKMQKNFSNYVKRPFQDEVIRPKLRDITQERLDREAATGIREVTTIVS